MAHRITLGAVAATIAAAAALGTPQPAQAHWVPAPCDFVTAGGYIFKDNFQMANFGVHGGCKNGEFWGEVNYKDHETGYHLVSTRITGYLYDPAMPNARDICGFGRIDGQEQEIMFRVRVADNGEPGKNDLFGFMTDNWYTAGPRFYRVTARKLANGEGGGGNVQLHKANPSNTAGEGFFQLKESQMCGDMPTP